MALHAGIAVIAIAAAAWAASYGGESSAAGTGIVPSYTISGIVGTGAYSSPAAFYQPGNSLQTRDSVAALSSTRDVSALRATGAVSPTSSFSTGVAVAAASSGESGAGIKPLADILDPTVPFVLYVAQPGDSVALIAEKYDVEMRTILDNNPTVEETGLLLLGQELIVPRDDGILYKIGHGETLQSIVDQFDNISLAIAQDYRPNNIQDPNTLRPGEFVLLPGATVKPPPPPPPPPPAPAPAPASGSSSGDGDSGGGGGGGQGSAPLPGGSGLFSHPLAAYLRVSDPFGVSRGGGTIHTGIDLDLYGYHHSNIFAACSGTVSRTEYLTYSYGYHIIIDCGDGWTTLYAHLSQILVTPGQSVSAGTVIGVSGVTGYTTGEHLHFEIRKNGAHVNPAAYISF